MRSAELLLDEQEDRGLLQSVAEFNLYLVRYIHDSWLQTVKLSPLVRQLRQKGHADYHLSHYLLKQFQLNNEFDYEFLEEYKCIALIDQAGLMRLAFLLGVTLHEEVIRSVLVSSQKLALEHCLGADIYRYAVKKAQFILPFGKQAPGPSLLIDWDHLERFRHYLLVTGLQVMAKAFEDCPQAFKKRLALKLPQEWQENLAESGQQNLSAEQCQRILVKVHKQVNKAWHLR